MKPLDRFLQRWRNNKVRPFLTQGARVLDIGCSDGVLSREVSGLGEYVGIDPDTESETQDNNARIIKGLFPNDLPDARPFDAITMLAVLEHIPTEQQKPFAENCAKYLKAGGYLLITVPSPVVDRILDVLMFFKLIDGMALEQHYEFDVSQTPSIFSSAGLKLVAARKFQIGLNNLFVFQKA